MLPVRVLPLIASSSTRDALARIGERWFCGIDLGTTNSVASVVDADAIARGDLRSAVRTVRIRQQTMNGAVDSVLLPSVVAEAVPGMRQVGAGAKEARGQGLRKDRQIFYATKSDMGIGREPYYPFAPSDLNCPYKVAAQILQTLKEAIAAQAGPEALRNVVVTVPASFQLSARRDTGRAAELAGFCVAEQALLDEPNAAFLDYILAGAQVESALTTLDFGSPRIILVFDFGGGTCDISILRVQVDPHGCRLNIANLAISRYERLGGDNIDAAIAENVLMPELLRQNGIDALTLSWAEKKNYVLPQLLTLAEALKLGICAEYGAQLSVRTKASVDQNKIEATQLSVTVTVPGRDRIRQFRLESPTLSFQEFERTLAPFLDCDLLYPRATEFNSITSIFAPITDALGRANLKPADVDGILLVGGSSLIPQVQHGLQDYFPESMLLRFPDVDRTFYAVSRGAALHSFFLHGLRRPLLRPIAQETIGVLARGDVFQPLIEAGTEVPYPPDGTCACYDGLSVPQDIMREIGIVIAADTSWREKKILAVAHLVPSELAAAGAPIRLRYRVDANKLLQVEASLLDHPNTKCEISLENPLSSTGHETKRQHEILELEQELADAIVKGIPLRQKLSQIERLAGLLYDEKKFERAIDWTRKALQLRDQPDIYDLNLIGNAYDSLGAYDRAEKMYREVIDAERGWGGAHFNLALALEKQGRAQEALAAVHEAMRLQPEEGAFVALCGQILQRLSRQSEASQAYREAARLLDRSRPMSEFQLSWRIAAAEYLKDTRTICELEQQRRTKRVQEQACFDAATLPKAGEAITLIPRRA